MTTPQKLAQDVAARAAAMAQKTNMRLLGVVENMSGDVFGSGGGEELAGELGVPLLGTVPLDPALREQGDAGAPIVSAQPEAEIGAGDRRDRAGDRGAPSRARRHRQVAAARRLSERRPRGRGRLLRPRSHAAARARRLSRSPARSASAG